MIQKPTLEQLESIDLSGLEPLLSEGRRNEGIFMRPAGIEHYKLLAWLSTQYSGKTLIEVGTLDGMGTIALSYNSDNRVVSYDIKECSWKCQVPPNAELRIVDENFYDEIMKSDFVFYDGAHEGKDEEVFLDELLKRDWHGVIVWDDIHLNKEMERFWDRCLKAGLQCEDWTDLGHGGKSRGTRHSPSRVAGTGIMFL